MSRKILPFVRKNEPIIDSDYFGSEKIPISNMLSILEILEATKKYADEVNEKGNDDEKRT